MSDCDEPGCSCRWNSVITPPTPNTIAIESTPGYGLGFGPRERLETDVQEPAPQENTEVDEPVLLSIRDYLPDVRFQVVGDIPQPLTVQSLRLPSGRTVSVLTRPDEYNGYVIRSMVGGRIIDPFTLVFTTGMLESGGLYRFSSDTEVFSTQLSLFQVSVRRVSRANGVVSEEK